MSSSGSSGLGKMFLGLLISLLSLLTGWIVYLLIFAYSGEFYLGALAFLFPLLGFYLSYKGKKAAKKIGKRGILGSIGIFISVLSILILVVFMLSFEYLESFFENNDNFNIDALEEEMNNNKKRRFRRKK